MSRTQHGMLAGVDVGATGIRARITSEGTSVERRRRIPLPRQAGQLDIRTLCNAIVDELRSAAAEFCRSDFQGLALGIAGIPGLVQDPTDISNRLDETLDLSGRVAVASDAVTTHLGALGGASGTVVAAGTGVIALATNHADIYHKIDGWGVLLGDQGGGSWIGRLGLQSALRWLDGRSNGSETLANELRERFGDPITLLEKISSSPSPANELASFTPAVATAARFGDPVARQILLEAAKELARCVVAGAHYAPARISWGGGLFNMGSLLEDPFRVAVRQSLLDTEVHPPEGNALDGALLLARQVASGGLAPRAPLLYVSNHQVSVG